MCITACAMLLAIPRFLAKTEVTASGCRIWTGAQTKGGLGKYKVRKCNGKTRLKGKPRPNDKNPSYGKFWVGPGKKDTVQAHVFAAWLAGKIQTFRVPNGFHLDHHCEHGNGTLCMDCTELVPAAVNLERARTRPILKATRLPPSKLKPRSRAKQRGSGNPKKVCYGQKVLAGGGHLGQSNEMGRCPADRRKMMLTEFTNLSFGKTYATKTALRRRLEQDKSLYDEHDDRYVVVRTPEGRWTALVVLDMAKGGYIGRYEFLKIGKR